MCPRRAPLQHRAPAYDSTRRRPRAEPAPCEGVARLLRPGGTSSCTRRTPWYRCPVGTPTSAGCGPTVATWLSGGGLDPVEGTRSSLVPVPAAAPTTRDEEMTEGPGQPASEQHPLADPWTGAP